MARINSTNAEKEMGFLDHLEELRWRIIKILIALVLGTVGAFLFSDQAIDILMRPSRQVGSEMTIQVLKIQGLLMLKFKVAFLLGLVIALPIVAYQFWAFISPGLLQNEKRWGPGLIIGVTVFFLLGAIFAFFVLIPIALKFLIGIGVAGVERNISIEYYTKFVMQLILATGLIFQMPVLSFILTKIGLITPQFLRKSWRYAIIILMVIAAIITPPDPVSMIFMTLPLLFLYEISIWISRIASRPKIQNETDQIELAG
ncbi:MAG TPA: twin-arginine translocase subunit TatC [Candidatus Marinimicrobia bacterium]|jgi:sec-independent protein translocase protein TatC|nr:twin-arginine translocase subunit TatC [Candidatus Neomarinimicrobiota bacterium]HOD37258.1 twin-arginine translocase subunit TatC [Candidatus Neomarinimicrobiota bacterium]HOO15106.1 twin-arginine translocase subunit TatC [Candidatus Neomarinimicrobiota bacterium]HPA99293.1 twin-arginine translocase subunit TatC [Candidatus Neomarinimicrobiota bacterium]HQC61471.1 twin-arginine translocase subunit TatC [Candidatus Neomarinimicrobiota bacterium]